MRAVRAIFLAGLALLAACGGGDEVASLGTMGVVSGLPGRVGPGLATDSDGNLFFASPVPNTGWTTVMKRKPTGEVTPASATPFDGPLGMAADRNGNVFVVERGPDQVGIYIPTVRRIDRQGQVTSVAGNVPVINLPVIGPPIAVGPDGSFHVSSVGTLRKVTPEGAVVNVTAPEVRRTIDSIAVDAKGNVYFGVANEVRKIVPGQPEVVLAGGLRFGSNVNNAVSWGLHSSLVVDSAGNVYVANNGDHTIRKISPAGLVTIVAGQPGVAGLEAGPLPGKLTAPGGLALQGDKILYVTSRDTLLRIDLP